MGSCPHRQIVEDNVLTQECNLIPHVHASFQGQGTVLLRVSLEEGIGATCCRHQETSVSYYKYLNKKFYLDSFYLK